MPTKPTRKNKPRKPPAVTPSSGNVFADLNLPDADELLAKAGIASKIYTLIRSSGMNQTQAAQRLGTDRARVSNLMRGRLDEFSLERLFHFLNQLGQDVHITFEPAKSPTGKIRIRAVA